LEDVMEVNKILMLNIAFALPDSFEGSFNDALQLFLDYRKLKKTEVPGRDANYSEKDIRKIEESRDIVFTHLEKVFLEGYRLTGAISLAEKNKESQEWDNLIHFEVKGSGEKK
jgi:hypothetical protein